MDLREDMLEKKNKDESEALKMMKLAIKVGNGGFGTRT